MFANTKKNKGLDPSTIIFCPHNFEGTGNPCREPLGQLLPGEHGRQITTLEGVRVTSRDDGGFYLHCPSCGKGYYWKLSLCVPLDEVRSKLETAAIMGWKFIRFGGTKKRSSEVLLK